MTVDPRVVKDQMMDVVRASSPLNASDQNYLHMSHIGRCPVLQYDWLTAGRYAPTDREYLNCDSGHSIERRMKEILCAAGWIGEEWLEVNQRTYEIRAPWDSRFRGHPDALTRDDLGLVEVKSFKPDEYDRIVESGRLPQAPYWQVQSYMTYDEHRETNRHRGTLFIAVCREPFDYWVLVVGWDPQAAERIEAKARQILEAVDHGDRRALRCTCGQHDSAKERTGYPVRGERLVRASQLPRRRELTVRR